MSSAIATLLYDPLQEIAERIGPRFARSEARDHAIAYMRALLQPSDRKNGWQIAALAGEKTPYAVQHLLGRARWSADRVRDDLRQFVVEQLGEEDGVLVLTEMSFPKKGEKSAGVARQHCAATGKTENCQIGVFLGYVTSKGCALIDRELYLPKEWIDDPDRCAKAGIPAGTKYASKSTLGRRMLERAFRARVPARGLLGSRIFAESVRLNLWLSDQGHISFGDDGPEGLLAVDQIVRGVGDYEVRSAQGWLRHVTLAIAAGFVGREVWDVKEGVRSLSSIRETILD